MTKIRKILPLVAVAGLLCGCQREDWRVAVLHVPGLDSESAKSNVVEAVSRFGGVDRTSLKFDFAKREVSVRYDSMQLAKMNLLSAIEESGVKVEMPDVKKKSGKAGYVNER